MRARSWGLRFVALLPLAMVLVSCPPEQALDLIVDQSGTVSNSVVSSLSGVIRQQIADDFVVAAGQSMIAVVEWWGNEASDDATDETFVIRFFKDDGSDHPEQNPLYAIPVGCKRTPDLPLSCRADSVHVDAGKHVLSFHHQSDTELGLEYALIRKRCQFLPKHG